MTTTIGAVDSRVRRGIVVEPVAAHLVGRSPAAGERTARRSADRPLAPAAVGIIIARAPRAARNGGTRVLGEEPVARRRPGTQEPLAGVRPAQAEAIVEAQPAGDAARPGRELAARRERTGRGGVGRAFHRTRALRHGVAVASHALVDQQVAIVAETIAEVRVAVLVHPGIDRRCAYRRGDARRSRDADAGVRVRRRIVVAIQVVADAARRAGGRRSDHRHETVLITERITVKIRPTRNTRLTMIRSIAKRIRRTTNNRTITISINSTNSQIIQERRMRARIDSRGANRLGGARRSRNDKRTLRMNRRIIITITSTVDTRIHATISGTERTLASHLAIDITIIILIATNINRSQDRSVDPTGTKRIITIIILIITDLLAARIDRTITIQAISRLGIGTTIIGSTNSRKEKAARYVQARILRLRNAVRWPERILTQNERVFF